MTQQDEPKIKASPRPETTVIIHLKTGQYRMHRFPGIQNGFELDLKLNSLLNEMHDGNIKSTVKVVRKHADGSFRTQEIKIVGRSDLE